MNQFFSEKEIKVLQSITGSTISHVLYHVWTNVSKPSEIFESLDWLELRFEDQSRIILTAGEESDGIKIAEINMVDEIERVKEQFGGQIEIRSYLMNEMEIWKPAIGNPIREVSFHQVRKEKVMNDEITLKFEGEEDHQLMISLSSEEGLLVELHEDDI
ncbi:hypothetical protein V6R21_17200 [Limibacter armeniacum]|uniref:hypothetical protein n=1 Tax=Limibacter armeniacum TaxID=466084 RepID=UPI002FE60642